MIKDPLGGLRLSFTRIAWMLVLLSAVPSLLTPFLIPGLVFRFLQWNIIWIFVIQVVLAFIYYNSEKDLTIPAVSIILLLIGLIDTYHLMVEIGAVASVPLNHSVSTYIWSICRISNALLLGLCIIILSRRNSWWDIKRKKLALSIITALVIIAMGLVHMVVKAKIPFQLIFLDSMIKRPWDFAALLVFSVFALANLKKLKSPGKNMFDTAVFISLIPMIIAQLHTSLGSIVHLDGHFMAAYYTRVIAYIIPLVGLIASNIGIGLTKAYMFGQLAETQEILQSKTDALKIEVKNKEMAEKQLQQSRDFFMAVLETAAEAIIIIDELGQIQFFNNAAEDIFQYSRAEVIGQKVNILMPDPHRQEHDNYIRNYLDTRQAKIIGTSREVDGFRKDGTLFPLRLSVSNVLVEGRYHFIGIVDDITDTVTYRQELMSKTRQLEHSNRIKDEFISTVSHELRTPLVSMLGYIDLLLDGDAGEINEEQEEFLGIVSKNTERLNELINDLLDIQKLETGQLEFARDQISLSQIVADIRDKFSPQAEEKQLDFTSEIPSNIHFLGDMFRINQALSNLVSNAIKYTLEGGIELKLKAEGSEICITVRDSGIGMSPDQTEQIFERFFRADEEVVQQAGGTGLGLSIARAIIEEMGGRIEVRSEKDKGSQFTVCFPALKSSPFDNQEINREPESGFQKVDKNNAAESCRVIIADNDEGLIEILAKLLSDREYPLEICRSESELASHLQHGKIKLIVMTSDFGGKEIIDRLVKIKSEQESEISVILINPEKTERPLSDQMKALAPKKQLSKGMGVSQIWESIKKEL